MKQIPILFSTPMVQAILEGRKSQTRRVLKHPKNIPADHILRPDFMKDKSIVWFQNPGYDNVGYSYDCPYGKPGDILWVRETFRKYCNVDEYGYTRYDQEIIEFAADNPPMINECDGDGCTMFKKDGTEKFISWKPSIHMPKEAARIWLQVTDVKVELLQDITEDDAISEGVEKMGEFVFPYKHYASGAASCIDAKTSFRTLWQEINGDESWVLNPWVWVISFKVLSITGKPNALTPKTGEDE